MELAQGPRGRGCCRSSLIIDAPSFVYTIAYAAELLGEGKEWLHELAEQLGPEDGRLWIYNTDDRATLGFIERGVERLKELILHQKR